MRKTIIVALVGFTIGASAWLLTKTYHQINQKQQVSLRSQYLPPVRLLGLDSTCFVVETKQQPTVIFYFDPNCEHCQNEAQALVKQCKDFSNVQLIWVSTEKMELIRQFEQQYHLQRVFPFLKIAQIKLEDANKQFGFRIVPTILIYNAKGKLLKKYVGETKIEALVKYLYQPNF